MRLTDLHRELLGVIAELLAEACVEGPPAESHAIALRISLSCKAFQLFDSQSFDLWRRWALHHFPCVRLYVDMGSRIGWKRVYVRHIVAFNSGPESASPDVLTRCFVEPGNWFDHGDALLVLLVSVPGRMIAYGTVRFANGAHHDFGDLAFHMHHHGGAPTIQTAAVVYMDLFAASWESGRMVRLAATSLRFPRAGQDISYVSMAMRNGGVSFRTRLVATDRGHSIGYICCIRRGATVPHAAFHRYAMELVSGGQLEDGPVQRFAHLAEDGIVVL